MAAPKRADPPVDEDDDDDIEDDDLPDLEVRPGSLKTWRTKRGTVIGVTAQLDTGEWVAMTADGEDLTAHTNQDDASLHLTLAYMRRAR